MLFLHMFSECISLCSLKLKILTNILTIMPCVCRLFENQPETQELFVPFRGIPPGNLRYNTELRAHALRVMQVVEKVRLLWLRPFSHIERD